MQRSAFHQRAAADPAAAEVARLERLVETDRLEETFRIAATSLESRGDVEMARRLRHAQSVVNARLGLRGD